MAIVILSVLVAFPLSISYLLSKYKGRLQQKIYKNKYGTIYDGIRHDIIASDLVTYIAYYFVRRIVLAVTVVLLDHVLVIQFFIFVSSSIVQVVLVGFINPFRER